MHSRKDAVGVNDYVILSERISRVSADRMTTGQVVAVNGDSLTVVPVGTKDSVSVKRSDVQSYQDVYGTAIPAEGARPIVNMMHK